MRLIRFALRVLHLGMSLIERSGLPLKRPDDCWTAIFMRFQDGTIRTFIFHRRFLDGRVLQDALDPLIDEMQGAEFDGPIEVWRSRKSGDLQHEVIGLLVPDD